MTDGQQILIDPKKKRPMDGSQPDANLEWERKREIKNQLSLVQKKEMALIFDLKAIPRNNNNNNNNNSVTH